MYNDGSGPKRRCLLKNSAIQSAHPENQPRITYFCSGRRGLNGLMPANRSRSADAPTVAAPIVRAPPVLDWRAVVPSEWRGWRWDERREPPRSGQCSKPEEALEADSEVSAVWRCSF